MPTLYLLPALIDEEGVGHIPEMNKKIIASLGHFIVERARSSRRFIRKILPDFSFEGVEFYEMDKHGPGRDVMRWEELFASGVDAGLLSEVGLPCIADPGEEIVDLARRDGYIIRPLSGPCCIFLLLMASGLNAERFTFHGYLPIKDKDLKNKLMMIDHSISSEDMSHLFIETPYRNKRMLEFILKTVKGHTRLCIGQRLTSESEWIVTRPINEWHGEQLDKVPTTFILGR